MKLELIQALGHAAEGQTVGWIGNRWKEIGDDFLFAHKVCGDIPGIAICKANGREEISFHNGGRLVFLTPHRSRGFSLDRAYIPVRASEELLSSILPALDTTGGPVIAY
ncbi:hypothetical protein PP356_gp71 [Arthrobacter phage MargaretKali]|uniref:Uncharacterized protein n=1 Tax=Arthrobacter phage MargaretKali TaxID=2250414 RepID=A0A345KN49_9CAUD|nr:hypothetical protein PP356_gp71 [Arthrobacter phage MargaretKali]AXH44451.1 hypothetical protein SEA_MARGARETKALI_71 [Arthrobacter phage MargaretKali]